MQALPVYLNYFWSYALFKEYDDKIKEQIVDGIVEEAPATTTSKENPTQACSEPIR